MDKDKKNPDEIIRKYMGFSMIAGALPVPLLDIAAVTAVQATMIRELSDCYHVDFDEEKSKTLITALIGSTIGTTLGRTGASIVKVIPGIGSLLGLGSQVVLSGASTYAVGKVFDKHFREDGNLSNFSADSFRQFFEEMFRKGKEEARQKRKEQPSDNNASARETRNRNREEIWDRLYKLKDLQEQGIISEADYEQAREQAFGNRS